MSWLIYTFLGGLFIGSSMFFRKMATKTSGSVGSFIIEGIVYGLLVLCLFLFQKNKVAIFSQPLYASLSAVALFIGAMSLYKALSMGKLSVTNVVYLVLSLAVVLILSLIFLREQLAVKQIIGLILAIAAIFLLT